MILAMWARPIYIEAKGKEFLVVEQCGTSPHCYLLTAFTFTNWTVSTM
jgi:hypothetical protein